MASFFKSILFSQKVEIDDSDSESELDDDNFDKDFIDKLNIDLNIYDKFTKYLLIKYFNPDNLIDKNRKYLTLKMDLNCVKYFNK